MRALLVQYDIAWENKPANHTRLFQLVHAIPPLEGDLILLPEMFDTGFSLNLEATAHDAEQSIAFLRDLAIARQATVAGSISITASDGLGRNRFLAYAPSGELIAQYDKIHPFSFGRESERFAAGQAITTFKWNHSTVFPTICYDLRFPELYRAGIDRGADIITIVANWPCARHEHWRTLAIARAIENQAWVLALNRVGSDPHLEYAGGSLIIDPRGTVIAEGDGVREEILIAPIEPDAARRWREKFPALRDRKIGGFWDALAKS